LHGNRISESILHTQPDFVKLAESYSIRGYKVDNKEDLIPILSEVFAYDGPVLVDCRVLQQEKVFPMIAPGKGIHEMIGVKP
jgi:acetolactate synthase-1/2/3 large subunit